MEIKKSDKANLDLHRSTGFLLGLVFALALLFAAFEYTSRPSDLQEDDSMLDDMSDDLEMTAAMNTKDMVSAAPAPASKALTQNVKEVDKTQNADKVAPITSKLVIGDGQGLAKQANVTEAIPETSALPQDTAAVLRTVEQLPEFPGGIVEFMKWLTRNLRYPPIAQQQKIQGKVVVSFIINKDGSIASPRIVTSADPILDREAMRVVKMMPRWKPGMEDGKPCRTMFAIPVNFQL
ncbi:MAG: energy transducer TonB [Prevotella sp.]|jgi:protein TonB|nr:energy transducer TonB [Prevotella sp.]